ncbi:MAG TPA: response regulator transcription factor [Burkholderiales bacterium]|jgi:DNA-binding NarL/FixJ family response regulator|nr:response regulator transcription factor [Burkholderiales bacterium]
MKPAAIPRAAKSVRKDVQEKTKAATVRWTGSNDEPEEHRDAYAVHLTPRELEVLTLLAEGLPNKLIGRRLKISSGTIKVHISNIFRALHVSSRLQAVLLARALDLVQEPADTDRVKHIFRARHR